MIEEERSKENTTRKQIHLSNRDEYICIIRYLINCLSTNRTMLQRHATPHHFVEFFLNLFSSEIRHFLHLIRRHCSSFLEYIWCSFADDIWNAWLCWMWNDRLEWNERAHKHHSYSPASCTNTIHLWISNFTEIIYSLGKFFFIYIFLLFHKYKTRSENMSRRSMVEVWNMRMNYEYTRIIWICQRGVFNFH